MKKAAEDLTEDQEADQESLSAYITKTCMGQLSPSESATE